MDADVGAQYDFHHAGRSAILLTGGASRRMGFDKGSIIVGGEPLAARLARLLREAGWEPTVLGRQPLQGYGFFPDRAEEAGPLTALREFMPETALVFVLSCDVPLFDGKIPRILEERLCFKQAAIPSLEGRLQPLCGLYRRESWAQLHQVESLRIMDWVGAIEFEAVSEADLFRAGAHPDWCKGVNTRSELEALFGRSL